MRSALARALKYLQAHSGSPRTRLQSLARALWRGGGASRHAGALRRMDLERPRNLRQRLQRRLLVWALQASAGRSE